VGGLGLTLLEPGTGEAPVWAGEAQSHDGGQLVRSLACHADGRIAAGHEEGSVSMWDPGYGPAPLWQRRAAAWPVWALAWEPEGRYLAAVARNRMLVVFRARDGEVLARYGMAAHVLAVEWVGDELWAAGTGGASGRPHVYRLRLEGMWLG